jgi:hypothetical protein
MRTAFAALIALATAAAAASATAQPADPGPDIPMPGVNGYDHPQIGADACKVVSPSVAQCTIPPRTAGQYLVVASGTSTAKAAGAAQRLTIGGQNWYCQPAVDTTKWSSGPRTITVGCLIQVLTDRPLVVSVRYDDQNAEKDPKGPTLTLRPVPWSGVLSTTYVGGNAK